MVAQDRGDGDLRELGIGVTAYGVLARGLISGHWSKARQQARHAQERAAFRRPEDPEHNFALVEALKAIARDRGTTVAVIAIAWALAQGPDIVPLVGARRRRPNGGVLRGLAADPSSPADIVAIEAAIPKRLGEGRAIPDLRDGASGQRARVTLAARPRNPTSRASSASRRRRSGASGCQSALFSTVPRRIPSEGRAIS